MSGQWNLPTINLKKTTKIWTDQEKSYTFQNYKGTSISLVTRRYQVQMSPNNSRTTTRQTTTSPRITSTTESILPDGPRKSTQPISRPTTRPGTSTRSTSQSRSTSEHEPLRSRNLSNEYFITEELAFGN